MMNAVLLAIVVIIGIYLLIRVNTFGLWTFVCFILPSVVIIDNNAYLFKSIAFLFCIAVLVPYIILVALNKENIRLVSTNKYEYIGSLNEKLSSYIFILKNHFKDTSNSNYKNKYKSERKKESKKNKSDKSGKTNSNESTVNDKSSDERTSWEILGIPEGSSKSVIKKAYSLKARQYHPDRMPESYSNNPTMKKAYNDECAAINVAYGMLKKR